MSSLNIYHPRPQHDSLSAPVAISVPVHACAQCPASLRSLTSPAIDQEAADSRRRSQSLTTGPAVTMGNESSLPLDMCATFDAEEIKRLGKRCEKRWKK